MARLTFPAERLVYIPGQWQAPLRSAAGVIYEVFVDEGHGTLADIVDLDGGEIEDSKVQVDFHSLLPEFLGPNDVDELWIRPVGAAPGTPAMPIQARTSAIEPSPGDDAYFEFTKSTPDTSWVIFHNLGKRPSVVVQDSAGRTVIGTLNYDSDSQLTIDFTAAIAGKAYCN